MTSPPPTTRKPTGPTDDRGAAPATDRPVSIPPEVLRASLRNSVLDAAAWSFMQGAGTGYVTPFIILGGKGLAYLGAITGLPMLAGAMVQWFAANVTDAVGRRNRIIVSSAVGQALTWLPICLAVFLPLRTAYWVMLAAFVANVALASFGQPAWQSLMGDLVPPERRGRYFGHRTGVSGAVQIASFFGAGWWLTFCHNQPAAGAWGLSGTNAGFVVLFALAGGARLVSAWFLSRVHEPEYRHSREDRFTLLDFIRRAPKAHFGRFVAYCALSQMGFGLVIPFLGWYLLDQLRFSPAAYAAVLTVSLALNVASQPAWGRLVDRIGSKRVLGIGGIALIAVPPLLLVGQSFWHFIAVMAYEGLALGAYNIAVAAYFYDVVTPPKRARCMAYNSLFVSLGLTLGNLGGGLIGQFAPVPRALGPLAVGHPFGLLLLCSLLVRVAANSSLLWSFAEFRVSRPRFAPTRDR